MNATVKLFLAATLVTVASAQSIEPPLSDTRLSVHTLVREDVFAGFLADDVERLGKAEKNLEILMEKRPAGKPHALAWKGGAKMYRAVRAHEAGQTDAFNRFYQEALDCFAQARQLNYADGGVAAVTGGTYVVLADRLPGPQREAGWTQAYEHYQSLWKQQGSIVEKLPVHMRGELLAGLAQSAQRTGRKQESAEYVEKMLAYLRDTPYESRAKQWKEKPETAAATNVTCRNCHEGGRLSARLASLEKK
jgi:tetratricopeptide (TPR) repeat protein